MTIKNKVLLVYPGTKAWGFTYPMGLLYVANALEKVGLEVSLLHLGTGTLKDLRLEDYLFVGINMMVGPAVGRGLEAARLIKNYNPAIPLVFGGVYPSILPEQVLANPLADIVVIGEGEETVKELAAALQAGSDLSAVKGLAYKAGGRVITTPPRELLDMDTLDFDLPYGLLGDIFRKSTVVPVHTSRGCPYRCGFCYSPLFNKRRYRFKSAARVVAEMEFLIGKYGIRNFNFDYEDEFLVNTDRAVEIFREVIKRGLKIRWSAFCRFNSFCSAYEKYGEEFLDLLKASGCFYLSFGAESGSQRLLDGIIKKDIKVEQIYATVEALKRRKINHRVSFMNCFPGETREDLEESFKVLDRISAGNPHLIIGIFNLLPLPQTTIMEVLQRDYGFKAPARMEDWNDFIPMSRERVTWHTPEYARYCYEIARLCPVPFHQDFGSYAEYQAYAGGSGGAYQSGPLAYLVARTQRWRYKRRLFGWNLEMALFTRALTAFNVAQNFLVNSVLKKYLSDALFAALRRRFGKNAWAVDTTDER